jgi:hypothetical protein
MLDILALALSVDSIMSRVQALNFLGCSSLPGKKCLGA